MSQPLEGITVLEIGHILSGPFCTMLLADMGARVIKIERPRQGDEARRLGPQVNGDSAYFMSVNRGKESVTVDFSRPEGKDLITELSKNVDVVVENFIPGSLKRFGLDHENLSSVNPRLVYASISGFGQEGPRAHDPALDIIVQAMGGIMSVTGETSRQPTRPGVSLGDSIAGLFAALSIVVALLKRGTTGRGQYVDVSMLDCQVTMMENAFSRYFATGQIPSPIGSRHPAAVPFQAFTTLDGHIVVAVLSDDSTYWTKFCEAIEHPELGNDPRFKDAWSRVKNYEVLRPIFDECMSRRSSQEWLSILTRFGVPCGPVNSVDEVIRDPQVIHRGMIAEIPHKKFGKWKVANTPFRFNGSPSGPQGSSPNLGEHTGKVLKELLGLSDDDLAKLKSEGII